MATAKKKHLIELMIEANVKWPSGADYATQDKSTRKVHFYKGEKPVRSKLDNEVWSDTEFECIWMGSEFAIEMSSLCYNWFQTIVTREQYEQAMAERRPAQPIEVRNCRFVTTSVSSTIEQRITSLHELEKQVEEARAELARDLEALGLTWMVRDEPEQPVITDWRDLKIGDVIECVLVHGVNGVESDESNNKFHGAECRVVGFASVGNNRIETDLKPDGYYIQEFKFIRRP